MKTLIILTIGLMAYSKPKKCPPCPALNQKTINELMDLDRHLREETRNTWKFNHGNPKSEIGQSIKITMP